MTTHNHDRSQFPPPAHLYDNGCDLCDAEEAAAAYASGGGPSAPWEDEDAMERQAVADIRTLLRHHGRQTGAEYRSAVLELGL